MAKVITIQMQGNTRILTFTVSLTSKYYSVAKLDLKSIISTLQDDPDWDRLILDLSRSRTVDSSGLGILISIYKRYNRRGKIITVKNMNSNVIEALESSGLMEIFNSHSEAVGEIDSDESNQKRHFAIEHHSPCLFFTPLVDLTISNVVAVKSELVEIFGQELDKGLQWDAIIFDLRNIKALDSASLGVLLGIYRRTKKIGKEFRIIGCDHGISQFCKAMGVSQLFPIETKA